MSPGDIALIAVAGFGAGVIGSTAGLASLVSYPALLLVGLPPVTANVTNAIGLIGSSVGSVSGSRLELTGQAPAVRRWLPLAVLGGAAGAGLLLVGPDQSFEAVVPFLVALASVLLLLSPRIRRLRTIGAPAGPGLAVGIVLSCAYGGYFGAAAGVMILALLLATSEQTLPDANALKNILLGAANGTAAVIFALTADVAWSAVLPMLIGCIVGGRLGPVVVRRVPEPVMRWTVGVAGLALGVRLGLQAFG
ncbi:MAG: hypothetical protein JWO46_438 [Nocardioidaceae bacterium]|nr:hypothetical protein [Nocardioidaceae bacterium]